ADTGRHCNRIHNFVPKIDSSQPALRPEAGMEACWVTFAALFTMIREGRFLAQLQIAALMLALMHPKARRSIPCPANPKYLAIVGRLDTRPTSSLNEVGERYGKSRRSGSARPASASSSL